MGVTESKPVSRVQAFAEGEKTKPKNADRSAGANAVAGRRTVLRSGSSRGRRLAMKEFVGLDEVAVHDNSDDEEEEFFRRKPTAKDTQQKTAPSSLNDVLGFLRSKKKKKTWQQRAMEKKANNNRGAVKEDEVYNEANGQAEKLRGLEEATRLQRKANSAAFKQGSYRPERDGSFAKKASRLRQERESRQSGPPQSILLKRGSSRRSLALRGDSQAEQRRSSHAEDARILMSSDLKRVHSHRRKIGRAHV